MQIHRIVSGMILINLLAIELDCYDSFLECMSQWLFCFCVSDYFLSWMVPAKDIHTFKQQFLRTSPCSNSASHFLEPGPSPFGCLGLKEDQLNGVHGHLQPLFPHFEHLAPTSAPYSEAYGGFSGKHGVQAIPKDVLHSSAQKRFLIFDQSGNDIRLFSSSFHLPSQNQGLTPNMPTVPWLKAGQPSLSRLIDKSHENYTSSEGSDVREDTEDIDALLSFCTEDDNEVDCENDELTSTGHSPFATTGGYEGAENVWELFEEVDSTDCSTKRQKLLNGGYEKSLLKDTAISLKLLRSSNYDDAVESSCAEGKNPDGDMDSTLSARQKQAKFWEKLRILQSILPGKKSKDPLLIIDETITYLQSLRQEAKGLEVS